MLHLRRQVGMRRGGDPPLHLFAPLDTVHSVDVGRLLVEPRRRATALVLDNRGALRLAPRNPRTLLGEQGDDSLNGNGGNDLGSTGEGDDATPNAVERIDENFALSTSMMDSLNGI